MEQKIRQNGNAEFSMTISTSRELWRYLFRGQKNSSAVSVIPLAFGYISLFCLLFMRCPTNSLFSWLAAPGRMALSNYLSQSLIGVLLFYGIGFGLGCSMGLVYIELTALTMFAVQIVVSGWWLQCFRFGPLEWIWRMLTYGNYFKLYPK